MNNLLNEKDEIYELEDTIPTFDADTDVIELLHNATTFGLDDEENEIPGYIFADSLSEMLGMSVEGLVDFARENGYDIVSAKVVGEELPANMFIICAKGCDLDLIKDDYKELYELDLELKLVEPEQEKQDEIDNSEKELSAVKESNELKKRARKHKKTDKKGARGFFVNPNAGNVEHNIEFFNNAMGSSVSESDAGIGEDFIEQKELTEVLPNEEESKVDFVSRFMKETEKEYPNPKQRYAVALKYWEKKK